VLSPIQFTTAPSLPIGLLPLVICQLRTYCEFLIAFESVLKSQTLGSLMSFMWAEAGALCYLIQAKSYGIYSVDRTIKRIIVLT
jgi:hypothetical protein